MDRYTFEYMVPEADRWTRSRHWFSDRNAAAEAGERFLRMMLPRAKDTLIRVVRLDA
jgi:hypothetical protein